MKKCLSYLGSMTVGAGLMFLLMHGEVVLGQEAEDIDLKPDVKLELRDKHLIKAREKTKSLKKMKETVLKNIGTRRILLNDFESCIKSANSHEDMKSCKNENKKRMEALHAKRKEMQEKMKEQRKKHRQEIGALRAERKEMREKRKDKREKLRREMEALRAEEKKMKGKMEKRRKEMD